MDRDAPVRDETRWKEISDLCAMLERIAPSPLHTMNRAVAVAEWLAAAPTEAVRNLLRRRLTTSGS